ncbi:hypothetical protein KFE25_011491 [Diacronema lutheri]|uniref:Plastid lipid-associated protein/fibrillin conserved domain-containing protein n=1 Tax=Diacronema lutheri TaxID=2081491 RepID=A0A8J5X5G8_DIALT|nr:hypothetical protein KFE25_009828 [Diacronema lutheri]KAG8462041.1 hypothetical protein KFE25_011491 [Diacronema lutheri]
MAGVVRLAALTLALAAHRAAPRARGGRARMSGATAPRASAGCELVTLGAVTDRGQRASAAQRTLARRLIAELEHTPGTGGEAADGELEGEWELVYATEAVYRASPFFAAFRGLTRGVDAVARPLGAPNAALSEAIFRITDGVPFKEVGVARQTINATHLVSRVELSINLFDALVPRAGSVMTSTAAILAPTGGGGAARVARLRVEQTRVLDSSLGALLPFLALDRLAFPTADVFERLRPGSSEVRLETTFLSHTLRVSRHRAGGADDADAAGGSDVAADSGAFVWSRVIVPPERSALAGGGGA